MAVVPWGNVAEDYLDAIGLSLDGFCEEMDGGWLFGYVEALQRAGARPFLVLVSSRIAAPERRTHRQTGAAVWFLPAPLAYLRLRPLLRDPYATSAGEGLASGPRWRRPLGLAARHLAPYLAWPGRAFGRVLESEGAAAILAQEYEYARFDLLAREARRRGLPLAASFQGGTWHVSALETVLRPRTIRQATLIIPTASEAARVQVRYGVPDARIHRVFNPLDVEGWTMPPKSQARHVLGIPPEARVAAWHGRVVRHPKGLDVLADAWARVVAARPGQDLRLLLTGTGADAEWLRERLVRPDVPGVHWHDAFVLDKAEIRQTLAAADAYVFSSRHEGFPVALVEALASGLPVAATDAPGVADILGLGEAEPVETVGTMVPREDPAALAEALGHLLDAPAEASRMGKVGRARAEGTFGLDAVGQALRAALGV